jgi:uncharacterized membrane protein
MSEPKTTEETAKPSKKAQKPVALLSGWFATGVAVVLPFAITIWILWAIVSFVDNTIVPLILPAVPEGARGIVAALPGLGGIIAVLGLTLAGALTANFLGRKVVGLTQTLFERVPLVSTLYASVKQIFDTITSPSGQSFKDAVLVEYPGPGLWSIGFVTNREVGEMAAHVGADAVAVYVPQAPIPTSGNLIYVRAGSLKPLTKSAEAALGLVMSAGVIKEK